MIQTMSGDATDRHSTGIVAALNSSAMKCTQGFAAVLQQRSEAKRFTERHRRAFTGQLEEGDFGECSSGLRSRRGIKGSLHVGHDIWAEEETQSDDPAQEDDSCVISLPSSSQIQTQMNRPQHRVAGVEGVEKMIGELAGTFQQMTGLVAQQHEMLSSIDQHMDNTTDHVQRGQDNLTKLLDGLKGNRPLVVKTFGVLLAFAIFFVVFLK
eukprot:TRINITY_DN18694_c0_g1_i2.p1 TRINITY_DN18694_c0_g1~~TRINITY_DN18694_c0_g1_i2.p1  ORF type:complete len:210 (+),score=37.03 TRINITY_DN18694_c0_g1_i2:284-913(+)